MMSDDEITRIVDNRNNEMVTIAFSSSAGAWNDFFSIKIMKNLDQLAKITTTDGSFRLWWLHIDDGKVYTKYRCEY